MITEGLKEQKRLQQLGTVAKVTAAMKSIEAEVDRDGFYAYNRSQITIKELCKRAGIGQSTLKNKGHEEFLGAVRGWLTRIRAKVTICRAGPVVTRSSVKIPGDQVGAFQQLNAFKIIYEEMSAKVTKLEAENSQLRKMLKTLMPRHVV